MFKEEYALLIVEKNSMHCKHFLANAPVAQRADRRLIGEAIDIDFPEQHTRESEIPSPGTSRR